MFIPSKYRNTFIVILILGHIIGGTIFYYSRKAPTVTPPSTISANGEVTLSLGETATGEGVTITPLAVLEDSRCPSDVQCIQAGRVRLRATLTSGLHTTDQIFIIGEPVTTEAEAIILLRVTPAPVSTKTINNEDYRFTFKIVKQTITYNNASEDLIVVETPFPGAVTGKQFTVTGQARGTWFFEASFPIKVLDKSGKELTVSIAQAQSDWMTESFVPFRANVTIPETYIGPATLVLQKDNPSDIREKDASISFPITIEY